MNSSIFCLVLLIFTSCHVGNCENTDVVRGNQDRFTNNPAGCSAANAVCLDKNCTYCQCEMNQTFVQTRGLYGKCVSNDLLVYATAYDVSFLMQNDRYKVCPYEKFFVRSRFVLGSPNCSTHHSRWIWTNYGQFLNMATLECVTDDFTNIFYPHLLTMKKCDRNNQKQIWKCVGNKKYYIMQTMSRRYMYYGEYYSYLTTTWSWSVQKWKAYNTEKDVCSQAVGCDTFSDSTSLIILNRKKCNEYSQCLGQKEVSLSNRPCFLSSNETQYLHNDEWKWIEMSAGSFAISSSENKVFLKWDLNKTPKSREGLLVKVHFKCENITKTHLTKHCVVIKYSGKFTENQWDKITNKTNVTHDDTDNRNKTKNETDVAGGNNDQDSNAGGIKDKFQTIIIIASVLATLCIVGVIVMYKCRKRFVHSKNGNTDNPDQNSSPVVDTPIYDQPAPRESQLCITPGKVHEYQYIYVNDSKSTGLPDNQQKSREPKGGNSYECVSSKRSMENNEQKSEEANALKKEKDEEVPLLYVTVTDDIQV